MLITCRAKKLTAFGRAVTVIKQQPVMVLFAVWLALGLLAPTRGDLSRTPGGC
jgi:hypothetical protein